MTFVRASAVSHLAIPTIRPGVRTCSRMSRRQYQTMDNLAESASSTRRRSSCGALEAAGNLAELVERHRAGPADRAPAGQSPWRSTGCSCATCRAGSSSARGSASWPPRPARTACWPPPEPVLAALRDVTGESAQLYRRQADERICVAAAERASGLRDTVPVGSVLPMTAGSAAQILLAWEEPERMHRCCRGASSPATILAEVRRRGWAQSVAEREPGVASVSAPVRDPAGGSSPRSASPARSSGSPASPGDCTLPPSSGLAERLTTVLRSTDE